MALRWWHRTRVARLRNPFNPWIFHVRAGYADEAEHMVQQLTTLGMNRIAVMYQDDGFGKAGLLGVTNALDKRKLKLAASAGYERNTDKVEEAVKKIKASDAQAIIMVSVNKSTAAFMKQYREGGGGAQMYNISVVDPAELVKLAGLKNAHGLGIRAHRLEDRRRSDDLGRGVRPGRTPPGNRQRSRWKSLIRASMRWCSDSISADRANTLALSRRDR